MSLKIEPAEGHVALELLDEGQKKSEGGIILTTGENPIVTARIVAVNPKEEWLEEGDIVYLRKVNAQSFSLEFGAVKLALQSAISAKVVNINDEVIEEQ